MNKNILALVFAFGMGFIRAECRGFEEAKAVFAPEFNFVEHLQTAVENRGDLSVLVDSPLVHFIHINHDQLATELAIFIDVMVAAHEQPVVQQAFAELSHLFQAFIADPALAGARDGKEIVTLVSYQEFKDARKATRHLLKSYYTKVADQIPLLYFCLESIESYVDELIDTRFDKALSALSWDAQLGRLVAQCRGRDWRIDDAFSEYGAFLSVVQYMMSSEFLAKSVMFAEPLKALTKAVCDCFGSDSIMNQLRALKVANNFEERKVNSERLLLLFAHPDIKKMNAALDKCVDCLRTFPFFSKLVEEDSLDDDSCDCDCKFDGTCDDCNECLNDTN